MIQLALFMLVAAGLFLSLYFLARHGGRAEGSAQALLEARQALSVLQSGLLSSYLVSQIFAKDDLEYVDLQKSAPVRRLFLGERKRIALAWVKRVRKEILNLRRFHNSSARFYSRLRLRTEIGLALEFQSLLFACLILEVAVHLGGPFAATRMAETAVVAAERICLVSAKSLGTLTPLQTGPLQIDRVS